MVHRVVLSLVFASIVSIPPAGFAQDASGLDSLTVQKATHDPDRDGALIGAAVGGLALGLYWSRSDCCPAIGFTFGAIVGGLAGMVVGGLIDASDAFEDDPPDPPPSPEEREGRR